MAQIAEEIELLLLDNESAQPGLDRAHRGRVLAAALLLDLAGQCRVRPSLPGEPVEAGRLVALTGGVPLDPAVRPALAMLEQGPLTPEAAIARLRKTAEDDVLDQLLRTGQIHQVQLSRQRLLLRTAYAWPIKRRDRVEAARARLHDVLFEDRSPDPVTAAVVALLHRAGGLQTALALSDDGARAAAARAEAITFGGWGDGDAGAANLALTAAAVLPAV